MSASAERLARLHRLTGDEYHRMAEAGVLGPEDRTELMEGAIIDTALIGSLHAASEVAKAPLGERAAQLPD